MFATPDLSHATLKDYSEVYEPAEDTFLLMDALEKDHEFIISIKPLICVEVGCGSGAVSAFLSKLFGPNAVYFCTDINTAAANLTLRTGQHNQTLLNPVVCDLLGDVMNLAVVHTLLQFHRDPVVYWIEVEPLKCRLRHTVDLLIFNPPYVVTPSEQVGSGQLEASWAGGTKGREVMDRLFVQVSSLLSEIGVFYVVILKDNDPDDVKDLCANVGLNAATVLHRRAGAERLSILRCCRQSQSNSRNSDFCQNIPL